MDDSLFDYDQVLRKDLANIVAKSASGTPLTAREHKMIEAEKAKSQKKPAAAPVVQPAPEQSAPPVELKRGRNGFFHQYPHYAEQYAQSERTVKRWKSLGLKNNDPIDLDDPEKVYIWWTRNMIKDHPPGILQALVEWRKLHPQIATTATTTAEPTEPTPSGAAFDQPITDDERGLDAMFARLEEFEVHFAREARQPGGAKTWLDTISRLTATMEKLRVEKEKAGQLIPKDQAEMILASLHSPIETAVRHSSADFCKACGVPHTPAIEAMWNITCDRIFTQLCQEVFHAL